jgi:micrococcal nuclease
VDPARLIAALAAAASVLVATGCDPLASEPPAPESARVAWIVDGDTLRLTDGRTVRLVQIDAPEARTDCYGNDATRALIRLAPKGTPVEILRDERLDDRDPYDRLLRYVLVGSRNVNVALIEQGAAAPYFFRNERGRFADELLRLARRARDQGAGFWGVCPRARLEPGLGSVTGPASTQRR